MTATPTDTVVNCDDCGLRFEVRSNHVGVLTLDRPDRMNAIDWPLYKALASAITQISEREDIRVVVIRGSGRAFCAGGDISFMRQMFEKEIDARTVQTTALRLLTELLALPQPSISVVNGPAIGLGATIALSCDIIFAGEAAVFADPHVQMGLVPGDGGIVIWPMLLGAPRAKELLFTGDPLSAHDAAAFGMINRVLPSDEVEASAFELADRLSQGPADTLRATKTLANHVVRDLAERTVRASLALELVSQDSDYHRRAVTQFLGGSKVRF